MKPFIFIMVMPSTNTRCHQNNRPSLNALIFIHKIVQAISHTSFQVWCAITPDISLSRAGDYWHCEKWGIKHDELCQFNNAQPFPSYGATNR